MFDFNYVKITKDEWQKVQDMYNNSLEEIKYLKGITSQSYLINKINELSNIIEINNSEIFALEKEKAKLKTIIINECATTSLLLKTIKEANDVLSDPRLVMKLNCGKSQSMSSVSMSSISSKDLCVNK